MLPSPGAVIQGVISSQDDKDTYRIEVPVAGTKIRLDLTDIPAGADYDLALVNEQAEILGESVQEGSVPETIALTLQGGGNYYAYVWTAANRSFNPAAPYTLALTLTPPAGAAVVEAPPVSSPVPTAAATPVPPAQASSMPWVGDIRFGYNPSGQGAVPSGSSMAAEPQVALYGIFSWRNVPAGSTLAAQALWGNDLMTEYHFTPTGPNGQAYKTIIIFGSGSGTTSTSGGYLQLVILLNGREAARGWVQIK